VTPLPSAIGWCDPPSASVGVSHPLANAHAGRTKEGMAQRHPLASRPGLQGPPPKTGPAECSPISQWPIGRCPLAPVWP
jgi:hypothetical protein